MSEGSGPYNPAGAEQHFGPQDSPETRRGYASGTSNGGKTETVGGIELSPAAAKEAREAKIDRVREEVKSLELESRALFGILSGGEELFDKYIEENRRLLRELEDVKKSLEPIMGTNEENLAKQVESNIENVKRDLEAYIKKVETAKEGVTKVKELANKIESAKEALVGLGEAEFFRLDSAGMGEAIEGAKKAKEELIQAKGQLAGLSADVLVKTFIDNNKLTQKIDQAIAVAEGDLPQAILQKEARDLEPDLNKKFEEVGVYLDETDSKYDDLTSVQIKDRNFEAKKKIEEIERKLARLSQVQGTLSGTESKKNLVRIIDSLVQDKKRLDKRFAIVEQAFKNKESEEKATKAAAETNSLRDKIKKDLSGLEKQESASIRAKIAEAEAKLPEFDAKLAVVNESISVIDNQKNQDAKSSVEASKNETEQIIVEARRVADILKSSEEALDSAESHKKFIQSAIGGYTKKIDYDDVAPARVAIGSAKFRVNQFDININNAGIAKTAFDCDKTKKAVDGIKKMKSDSEELIVKVQAILEKAEEAKGIRDEYEGYKDQSVGARDRIFSLLTSYFLSSGGNEIIQSKDLPVAEKVLKEVEKLFEIIETTYDNFLKLIKKKEKSEENKIIITLLKEVYDIRKEVLNGGLRRFRNLVERSRRGFDLSAGSSHGPESGDILVHLRKMGRFINRREVDEITGYLLAGDVARDKSLREAFAQIVKQNSGDEVFLGFLKGVFREFYLNFSGYNTTGVLHAGTQDSGVWESMGVLGWVQEINRSMFEKIPTTNREKKFSIELSKLRNLVGADLHDANPTRVDSALEDIENFLKNTKEKEGIEMEPEELRATFATMNFPYDLHSVVQAVVQEKAASTLSDLRKKLEICRSMAKLSREGSDGEDKLQTILELAQEYGPREAEKREKERQEKLRPLHEEVRQLEAKISRETDEGKAKKLKEKLQALNVKMEKLKRRMIHNNNENVYAAMFFREMVVNETNRKGKTTVRDYNEFRKAAEGMKMAKGEVRPSFGGYGDFLDGVSPLVMDKITQKIHFDITTRGFGEDKWAGQSLIGQSALSLSYEQVLSVKLGMSDAGNKKDEENMVPPVPLNSFGALAERTARGDWSSHMAVEAEKFALRRNIYDGPVDIGLDTSRDWSEQEAIRSGVAHLANIDVEDDPKKAVAKVAKKIETEIRANTDLKDMPPLVGRAVILASESKNPEGREALASAVKNIREDFDSVRDRVLSDFSDDDLAKLSWLNDWIYSDIADQIYYNQYEDQREPGYRVADPLFDRQKQLEMADHRLGFEVYRRCYSERGTMTPAEVEDNRNRLISTLDKEDITFGRVISFFERRPVFHDREGYASLSSRDYVALGALIRENLLPKEERQALREAGEKKKRLEMGKKGFSMPQFESVPDLSVEPSKDKIDHTVVDSIIDSVNNNNGRMDVRLASTHEAQVSLRWLRWYYEKNSSALPRDLQRYKELVKNLYSRADQKDKENMAWWRGAGVADWVGVVLTEDAKNKTKDLLRFVEGKNLPTPSEVNLNLPDTAAAILNAKASLESTKDIQKLADFKKLVLYIYDVIATYRERDDVDLWNRAGVADWVAYPISMPKVKSLKERITDGLKGKPVNSGTSQRPVSATPVLPTPQVAAVPAPQTPASTGQTRSTRTRPASSSPAPTAGIDPGRRRFLKAGLGIAGGVGAVGLGYKGLETLLESTKSGSRSESAGGGRGDIMTTSSSERVLNQATESGLTISKEEIKAIDWGHGLAEQFKNRIESINDDGIYRLKVLYNMQADDPREEVLARLQQQYKDFSLDNSDTSDVLQTVTSTDTESMEKKQRYSSRLESAFKNPSKELINRINDLSDQNGFDKKVFLGLVAYEFMEGRYRYTPDIGTVMYVNGIRRIADKFKSIRDEFNGDDFFALYAYKVDDKSRVSSEIIAAQNMTGIAKGKSKAELTRNGMVAVPFYKSLVNGTLDIPNEQKDFPFHVDKYADMVQIIMEE